MVLDVDIVITLTTLASGNKGSYPSPPPAEEFPLPYMEDFERKLTYIQYGYGEC